MQSCTFIQERIKKLGNLIRKRIHVFSSEYVHLHRNTRPDPHSAVMLQSLFSHLAKEPLHQYPDLTRLYTRLREWLGLPTDCFLLTQGVDDGIRTVFEAFSRPGKAIGCLEPSYLMYSIYAKAYDTPVHSIVPRYQGSEFVIEVQDVQKTLSEGLDILFIPNPNEPIETCFTFEEINFIIEDAAQYGTLVFVDEAYAQFGADSVIGLVEKHENLIVARSFSKWFGLPAIRLGYLAANSKLMKALHANRPAYETNALSMATALWALDNIPYFENYAAEVKETRQWLHEQLKKIGVSSHGDHSNAISISLSNANEAKNVASFLKSKGILVRNSLPSPGEHFIGVTVGSKTVMEYFLTVFREALVDSDPKYNI